MNNKVDSFICRELIRRCDFHIITIHDSFSCHPNNIDKLRIEYLTILKEIQQMNLLEYIGKQINPDFKWQPKDEPFEIAIDKDSYALC